MGHVTQREDGDTVVLKWGETGREHAARPGDEASAFTAAVAEGLASGDVVEGDVERAVAARLSEGVGVRKAADGSLYVAWFPFDGDGDDDDKFASELSSLTGGKV